MNEKSKVKHIWLMGGIGNQLFQINYGCYLVEQGYKVIYIDNLIRHNIVTTNVLRWSIHEYITNNVANIEIVNSKNILPILAAKLNVLNDWSIFLKNESYNIDNLAATHLFGYFQKPRYEDTSYINSVLKPELFEAKFRNYVVHLRFGDSEYGERFRSYYLDALRLVRHEKIYICSDDKIKALDILMKSGVNDFEFIAGDLYADFTAMINSKFLIIAPSTLSWWASKIAQKSEYIVCPKEYCSILGRPLEDKSNKLILL